MSRSTAENAQLALLLEVAATPKPGNVDRHREYEDLRFEQFLAGAVGARDGLDAMATGRAPVGEAFETAVGGMADQRGGNTQFGALLLLAPLVAAAGEGDLSPDGASTVVADTSVADACAFYRAFEHVDVAVREPPADLADLDVRRGAEAVTAVWDRDLTLSDVMALSTDRDGVAREWTGGFERTFDAATSIGEGDGPVTDRAATAFLELLADEPDEFVVTRNGRETAEWATERARAALAGDADPAELAEAFVERDVNPGTTADVVAGALFVALERGVAV